jgi:hypothetical protein
MLQKRHNRHNRYLLRIAVFGKTLRLIVADDGRKDIKRPHDWDKSDMFSHNSIARALLAALSGERLKSSWFTGARLGLREVPRVRAVCGFANALRSKNGTKLMRLFEAAAKPALQSMTRLCG